MEGTYIFSARNQEFIKNGHPATFNSMVDTLILEANGVCTSIKFGKGKYSIKKNLWSYEIVFKKDDSQMGTQNGGIYVHGNLKLTNEKNIRIYVDRSLNIYFEKNKIFTDPKLSPNN